MSDSPSEEHSTDRRSRPRRRRFSWWPLPVLALTGAAAGAAYGVLAPPQYAATTYVVAVPAKGSDPATALGFAQAYGRIATSTATLVHAGSAAGVPARTLGRHVRTETSPDSPMIGITGTATRARTSAEIANAVADAITLTGNEAAANTTVRLVLFSRAVAPSSRISPSPPISLAVGGCAGGLIGALALLVRPRRDQQVSGPSVPAPAQAADSAGTADTAAKAVDTAVKVKEHV
ncbi:lipopolysaccharide biosynthesis protein [Streptomyces sp. NBC_00344]|uniref:lipopolysaccharide biosynthesis protein n=1 Tax=Streptomyces sp. NBC_00344 TaxID=2975720 RepID=UPI002E1F0A2B